MDIIFGASIIAAFLAGMVALFAPCCITILLPAYAASALRTKRNVLAMTFIFFSGIAVVLIPIGLGAASLARVFQNFHRELYLAGGLLMIVMAVLAILGKGISLIPMPKRIAPRLDATHPRSAFLLGVFSGAATSCCAPVLAGAVTLAVISGAFWKALIVTFAYVFGMTIPLFLAAYFYDRFQIENSRIIRGKIFELRIGGKTRYIHSTNLFAGIVFLAVGVTLWTLAFSGNAFWAPQFQTAIGVRLAAWSQNILIVLRTVPESLWGIAIVGIFLLLAYAAKKRLSP